MAETENTDSGRKPAQPDPKDAPMIRRMIAATPMLASSIGFGWLGVTLLLVAHQSLECACFIVRGNDG